MHDRLLDFLLAIPGLREIRLVAAIRDPGLAFPAANDLRVFIPDMHLSSAAVAARYTYGFNCEPLFIQVCGALASMRARREPGETIEVYHIGDYLDLWRESGAPATDERVALDIKADHADLVDALEGDPLGAHFLLGNHDFDLWQWHDYEAWDRRYYLPSDNDPAILVMHGDYFDWLENMPEFIKDIAVNFFARFRKAPPDVLGKMMGQCHLLNGQCDYSRHLRLDAPAELGQMRDAHSAVPDRYNVTDHNFLAAAAAECRKVNQEIETNMRVVVIGHTHQARIATTTDPNGNLFTLIDTGAWVESCCEAEGGPTMPNAQITAISANEARIYQLVAE